MDIQKYNVVLLGVSYFDGMASSTRVRNLLEPLINKEVIEIKNLIYEKDAAGLKDKKGVLDKVTYQIIGFSKSNPFSIISFIYRGLKFLKRNKCKNKKNILYNYEHPDIKNISLILFAKITGYKILFDIVEDNRYYDKNQRFLSKLKIRSSVFLLNQSRYFADVILAISDHLLQIMKDIGKNEVPVYFIPITVDLKKFKISKSTPSKEIKIFYGGSFGAKDGLEYLIPAFQKISEKYKNAYLVLTGRGTKASSDRVKEMASTSIAKDRIIFKGYLSINDYYTLLNTCDIFCMTRVNSNAANAGFPFKLGEFLATGKAVVATKVGDVPKYLVNNRNAILINPNSSKEIIDGLSFIIENADKRTSLGLNGRKTAEKYFDSEKVSKRLLEILETL